MHDKKSQIQQLLAESDMAVRQSRWEAAGDIAEKILSIDPDQADALAVRHIAERLRTESDDDQNMEIPSGDDLIGRRDELQSLKESMYLAKSGRGRIDMLVGEPGIGKSRLAEEVCRVAQEAGMRVLGGRCYEEGGTPAFWPWTQILRDYLRSAPTDIVSSILGPRAPLLAELFPDLVPPIDGGESYMSSELEPRAIRFRLFDTVAAFFVNVSAEEPLVLTFDDLHWADEGSLNLLVFLAREIESSHIYILATYRDVDLDRKHPLSGTLGQLERERPFGRYRLRGFGLSGVRDCIQTVTGWRPSESLAGSVFELTNGNPLFVSQMARLIHSDRRFKDGFSKDSLPQRLPEGVREVIGRRLNQLTEVGNEVLRIAAVLGRGFRLQELLAVSGTENESSVIGSLDEAIRAHFIVPVPGQPGSFEFTHAMVRQTLIDEVPLNEGVKLHAQVAKVLERLYENDLSPHIDRLAEHSALAETVLGPEKAARYSLAAGEKALDQHADEDAVKHFSRGLSFLRERPLDKLKADTLFGLGSAQKNLLKFEDCLRNYSIAMDFYEEAGDLARMTAIASARLFWFSDIALCERALKHLPEGSLESGEVLTHYGFLHFMRDKDNGLAERSMLAALSVAEKHADLRLQARIHTLWAVAMWYKLDPDSSFDHAKRSIELSGRVADRSLEFLARQMIAEVHRLKGQMRLATEQVDMLQVISDETGDRWERQTHHAQRGRLALQAGDWSAARKHFDILVVKSNAYISYYHRALIEYETGNGDRGDFFVRRFSEYLEDNDERNMTCFAFWGLMMANIARISGDVSSIPEGIRTANRALTAERINTLGFYTARSALGHLSLLSGDLDTAGRQYSEIARLLDDESIGQTLYCQHEQYGEFLGLYMRAVGNLDGAVTHLSHTKEATVNNLPRHAWALYELAKTLDRRSCDGDRAEAARLRGRALEIAEDRSMSPLQSLLRGELRTAAAEPPVPGNLTPREIDVIRLIAAGKTDQEIGDSLYISSKTASNHVANILRKLHRGNRTEAARFASENGLLREDVAAADS